jgi:ABC-type nitrate/sulfonate/bicarbonate transport system substrate-binding protein
MGHVAARCRSIFLIFALALPATVYSQPRSPPSEKKISVAVIYEALAATNAPLWLAQDLSLYDKYNLDVKVIHARGATPVQALVSGAVELGAFSGSSAIAANLAGADLVFIAAKPNFSVISVWTRRDSTLKILAELRGKTIGVSRPGSATHAAARLALKSAGLGDKDVRFLHHGGLPEIFASLEQGLVDAAFSSPPRPGFREMVDLTTLKIPFLQGAIEVQRGFLASRRPIVASFLKAYVESIKVAREKPELAIAAVAKRMRLAPDAVRAAYAPHGRVWEEIPYVRTDSVQAILDLYPGEKNPERFIDNSPLRELEESGFVRELYRK